MTKYFLFLLFIICFAQCTQTKKTKSGIEYQIIEAKHGKRLNSGDFIQIHFSCMTDYDSVVSSSLAVKKPLVLQLNSNHEASEINEALAELSVGDSAVIYPNALNFLNNTMRMTAIPSKIKQNSKLKFNVRILKCSVLMKLPP